MSKNALRRWRFVAQGQLQRNRDAFESAKECSGTRRRCVQLAAFYGRQDALEQLLDLNQRRFIHALSVAGEWTSMASLVLPEASAVRAQSVRLRRGSSGFV